DNPAPFVSTLKRYNPELFDGYVKTPNQYVTASSGLETKPLYELYAAYWEELGLSKSNWLNVREEIANAEQLAQHAPKEMGVDTHNTASHKSADESHIGAFKIFAQPFVNEGDLFFAEQDSTSGLYRKVTVKNKNQLSSAVNEKNRELKTALDRLLAGDDDRQARIYNEFLRYSLTDNFIDVPYDKLEKEDKQYIDKEIDGFIFKAQAAQRYVDDMLNKHSIGGYYAYKTTNAATCGLNMEQMVAACYYATTDTQNFKEQKYLENQKKAAFVALVDQLYDMRRGYDIDDGTDKPSDNVFPSPSEAKADKNRCHGGGVNSLAGALSTIHNAYSVKMVTTAAIEADIASYYSKVNVLKMVQSMEVTPTPAELALWAETGIPPQTVKELLKKELEANYEKAFDALFKSYVTDDALADIKKKALDNIKMPDELKNQALNFDTLSAVEVFDAISNGSLPFLRFDQKEGYQTRLQYYCDKGESFKEGLIAYFNALASSIPINQQVLLFLASSNLPKDVARRIIIKKIGDVEFTLNDIQGLGAKEFATFISCDNEKDILDWCADNSSHIFNIVNLIGSKLVVDVGTELKGIYGSNKLNLLQIAAATNSTTLFINLLQNPNAQNLLLMQDLKCATPIHLAAQNGHANVLAAMLKYPDVRVALSMQDMDKDGDTPVHLAAQNGHAGALAVMLLYTEGCAALSKQNKTGYTPLQLAASQGHTAVIAAILQNEKANELLLTPDKDGNTLLHLAASKGHPNVIAEILKNNNAKELLLAPDKNGNTPLHLAASQG
ncbi:MAG: ankyrin repeat domain-containing protein, partial [Rickettsiales bacterium]